SDIEAELCGDVAYVYLSRGLPSAFSLLPLTHIESDECRSYPDVIEGLLSFIRSHWATREFVAVRERMSRAATHELEKVDRKIAALSSEADLKKTAEQWKKFGNLLMIHMLDTPSQHDRM